MWRVSLTMLALISCSGEGHVDPGPGPASPPARPVDDQDPPTARWQQADDLAADRDAPRHPSDGAGTVVLQLAEGEIAQVEAMASATWTLVYTAGPLGVAEGGALHFMPDPFWGWSPPQSRDPKRPGYTEISANVEGLELELVERSAGAGMSGSLTAILRGARLAEGEKIQLIYGAGSLGAFADRHAERGSRLWLMVDGDGDGVRQVIDASPTVTVLPGPASSLVLHGPSVARVGEEVIFRAAILDAMANVVESGVATLRVTQRPDGWGLPERVEITPGDRGAVSFRGIARGTGIARVAIELNLDGQALRAEANPLAVSPALARIRWADLHGHSQLSDGTGTPADWWRYARDVAGLDVAALTDHDHWGVRFLDQTPGLWEGLKDLARSVHVPGQFVALIGFEWTSWIHGHRHVLYFGEDGNLLSSLDPEHVTPRQLWSALDGEDALTIAHHSAGDPVPVNWTFAPPPHLEPVTEIMSVHGSSESLDSPRRVRRPVPGNTVRDQINKGLQLGFVASGDGHDGHPGLSHLSPVYGFRDGKVGTGGLAAILSEDLSRTSILEALRARRCYATSGPRILLDATLDGQPIGAEVEANTEPRMLRILVVGTADLRAIDLVTEGSIERIEVSGERRFQADLQLRDLTAGGYLYLRVEQVDGALAWASPWFLR